MDTKPLIGIDISTSSVKIMELSQEEGRYCLNKYGIELLPAQSGLEENIVDKNSIVAALKRLLDRLKINRPYAAIAVSGSSVFTRIIQIKANFDTDEIADQIEVEADRYIPYPMDEVYYDFEVIGSSAKQPEYNDILLASARIETVESKVKIVEAAKIKTTIVDIESLVIERAFSLIAHQLPNCALHRNVALMDIGSTVTTLHVFKNLKSIYSREQTFGGKHLIDEIQRRYGFSFDTAIAMQKKGDFPEDFSASVLEPFKETVTQQINRALQIFLSSSEESDIDELILAGGVANIFGLVDRVQNSTGITTIVANPFKDMIIDENIDRALLMHDAPALLSCCGLALRHFD